MLKRIWMPRKNQLKPLLFACCFVCVHLFCKKQTDGFTVSKITSHLPFHSKWEVLQPPEEKIVQEILSQPFRYLGKGAQSFVFASDDGKYVIKFFRYDHMGDKGFLKYLPFKRTKRRVGRLRAKLQQDFSSYKLAYDNLKDETALVYLHLNKTETLLERLELVDKLGISHFLSAGELEFVVQKRASLLVPALQDLMKKGQEEEAKAVISQLISLLKRRCQKEIFDKDPDLFTNFGIINGKPIQIDVGRFKADPSESDPHIYKDEIIRITDKLHKLLQEEYPSLDNELQKQITLL